MSRRTFATRAEFLAFAEEVNRSLTYSEYRGSSLEVQVQSYIDVNSIQITRSAFVDLVQEIDNRRTGYGPLSPLIADADITDIAVDRWDTVRVLRSGSTGWERIEGATFASEDDFSSVITNLVSKGGRTINRESPVVDASLEGGVRICALIPPVVGSPAMTIRKRRHLGIDLEAMVSGKTPMMSRVVGWLLDIAVISRLNILVAGGTGSGKTTLLAALIRQIDESERIVLIEDTPELEDQFAANGQTHIVALRADRDHAATSPDELLRASLRLAPDRIIVGEVRGAEALVLVRSLNTGHEGSLSSIHANSPFDAISRLATLCLDHPSRPPFEVVMSQIGSALHLIVQIGVDRADNGRRRVLEVAEVVWEGGDKVGVRTLFRYENNSWTAVERPSFWPRISHFWDAKRADPWANCA